MSITIRKILAGIITISLVVTLFMGLCSPKKAVADEPTIETNTNDSRVETLLDYSIDHVNLGKPFYAHAYLHDINYKQLEGEEIVLKIDNKEYRAITDETGHAVFYPLIFEDEADLGWHKNVECYYEGSELYQPKKALKQYIYVYPREKIETYMADETDVFTEDVNKSFEYGATLLDDDDNALSNKTINLLIDGVKKDFTTTDEEGKFSFSLCFDKDGVYDMELEFEGDDDYKPCYGGTYLFIGEHPFGIETNLVMQDVKKAYVGQSVLINATLYNDEDNTKLSDKKIDLYIDDEYIESLRTDINGEVSFKYTFDSTGTYEIYVEFDGDDDYAEMCDYCNCKVSKQVTTTEITTTQSPTTQVTTETNTTKETTALKTTTTTKRINRIDKVKRLRVRNKKKRKAVVRWKKTKGAKKYLVKYANNKKFKKSKKKIASTNRLTIKKLKKKRTYFFKVRGYSGIKHGAWSKVKKVKIKK